MFPGLLVLSHMPRDTGPADMELTCWWVFVGTLAMHLSCLLVIILFFISSNNIITTGNKDSTFHNLSFEPQGLIWSQSKDCHWTKFMKLQMKWELLLFASRREFSIIYEKDLVKEAKAKFPLYYDPIKTPKKSRLSPYIIALSAKPSCKATTVYLMSLNFRVRRDLSRSPHKPPMNFCCTYWEESMVFPRL